MQRALGWLLLAPEEFLSQSRFSDLTGPNDDDLGVPCGDLKREVGQIIAGQLGSSLLPDPTQEPDSLLRDHDYILDLFASMLLTTVFDT